MSRCASVNPGINAITKYVTMPISPQETTDTTKVNMRLSSQASILAPELAPFLFLASLDTRLELGVLFHPMDALLK